MNLRKISAIGRPIDPNYSTNRAIAIITVVVIVVSAVFRLGFGDSLVQGGLWGLGAGLSVFLAWALCRELDPDHDLSAFVAAAFALLGAVFVGLPQFLPLVWALMVIRILNRTTGLSASLWDSLSILALGGWLSLQGNWGYGFLTVLAFFLDSRLPPENRRHRTFAGLAAIATVATILLGESSWGATGTSLEGPRNALVLAALFVPVILGTAEVRVGCDLAGKPLSPLRVRSGQVIGLFSGIEVALWSRASGLQLMMPLWAAVLGAALYRLFVMFRKARGS